MYEQLFGSDCSLKFFVYSALFDLLLNITLLPERQFVYDFQLAECVSVYGEMWVVGLASISSDVISWQKGRGGPSSWKSLRVPGVNPLFGCSRVL